MEDCPDANRGAAATAAASLPNELILEILSRLPVRSIHRFKCVSKRWRDLIADPLHQKRLPQTLEGFFCSDNGARTHGRFICLPGRPAPLVDPSFSFLTKQPEMKNIKLLDSSNGLVLFKHRSDLASTPSYVVCNPATEQWVAVPSSGVTSHVGRDYLIFDPAASLHFHLVHIWQKHCPGAGIEVRVYSSETREWSDRVSDRLVNVGWGIARSGRIAFVNGMLHFIISDMWKGVVQLVAMGREGKPRIIPLPDGNVPFTLFVAQSQGRLHCMSRHLGNACPMTERGLSIWVLEDYDAGHWVLKHSVSFSELFGKMCGFRFSVVSIHPDCDGVFFIRYCDWKGDQQQRKLLSYDMHSKEVHALQNFGHAYCSLTPYVPYFSESSVPANKH